MKQFLLLAAFVIPLLPGFAQCESAGLLELKTGTFSRNQQVWQTERRNSSDSDALCSWQVSAFVMPEQKESWAILSLLAPGAPCVTENPQVILTLDDGSRIECGAMNGSNCRGLVSIYFWPVDKPEFDCTFAELGRKNLSAIRLTTGDGFTEVPFGETAAMQLLSAIKCAWMKIGKTE